MPGAGGGGAERSAGTSPLGPECHSWEPGRSLGPGEASLGWQWSRGHAVAGLTSPGAFIQKLRARPEELEKPEPRGPSGRSLECSFKYLLELAQYLPQVLAL